MTGRGEEQALTAQDFDRSGDAEHRPGWYQCENKLAAKAQSPPERAVRSLYRLQAFTIRRSLIPAFHIRRALAQ